MYSERNYRLEHSASGLVSFKINIKETDLWIAVDKLSYKPSLCSEIEEYVFQLRNALEEYIKVYPEFLSSFKPILLQPGIPDIAFDMIKASSIFSVGPMASVAGAFAQYIGEYLSVSCQEIIIENGGDIYIKTDRARLIAVFAGESPFSNRIGIKIPGKLVRGICTSSGTVGPSISYGKADAVVIVAENAVISDAAATMIGNMVTTEKDIPLAIEVAKKYKELLGILIIKDNKLGAYGELEIIPLDKGKKI